MRIACLAAIAALLSGCVTFVPPPLVCVPAAGATCKSINSKDMNDVLEYAETMRKGYMSNAKRLIDEDNNNSVAVIAGAVGAAAAAIYGAHEDVLAGFALLAGGNAAMRARFDPTKQYSVYRDGVRAVQCIVGVAKEAQSATTKVGLYSRTHRSRAALSGAPASTVRASLYIEEADNNLKNAPSTVYSHLTWLDDLVYQKLASTLGSVNGAAIRDSLVQSAMDAGKKEEVVNQANTLTQQEVQEVRTGLALKPSLEQCVVALK